MASTLVQIRVDEDLKNEATDIFERLGLDLPTAIRVFLKKSVEESGIPFNLKIDKNKKVSLKQGQKAFKQLRKEAKKNGLQDMNLDEINAEIKAYRQERRAAIAEGKWRMKIFAVIDTNVLVSALIKSHEDSATVKILLEVFNKTIIPVYSKEIIAEYSEVLSRNKFKKKFTSEAKNLLIKAIIDNGVELSGIATEEKPTDPDDVIFYEVTMDSRQTDETFLVTGNIKDFPIKPFVVQPEEMMRIIEERKKR